MTNEERENAIKVIRNFDLNNPKVNSLLFSAEEITNAFDMAIKALEQEPCDGAISRKSILKYIDDWWSDSRDDIEDLIIYITYLPPVTPQQKYGKWILLDECANSGYYCSNCQKKLVKEGWSNTVKKIKYCPNCGCRMVEPQESEDEG